MRYTKKIISILLSLILMCSVLYPALDVFASHTAHFEIAEFSPLGAAKMPELGEILDVNKSSKIYTSSGKNYYTEGKELYKIIHDKTQARAEKILLRMAFDARQYAFSLQYKLLDYIQTATSDEMSKSSIDGDYIYWHLSRLGCDLELVDQKKGKFYYDITLLLEYRATAKQEKEVDKVVESFVNSIKTSGKSDYEIIKAVHDFICKKAEYDYTALRFMNSSFVENYYYAFTAYGALVTGKTVCQGYALAFYRLCKELGYNCRFVSSDPYEGCHAWNIIELNGKYYFVDCTWDDQSDNYDFFLVDYDGIREQDSYNNEHTLDEDIYDEDKYFVDHYQKKFAVGDYDANDNTLLTNCTVSLSATSYTYNGNPKTPAVKVVAPDGTAISSSDYTVVYSGNTNAGEGRVNVKGVGEYAKSNAKRRFTIKPGKTAGLTVDGAKRTSSSVTLKWTKTASGASGYSIYRKTGSSWKSIADVSASKTSYTDKKLSSSQNYSYRIKEYKKVNNRKIYSDKWADKSTATEPKSPSLTLSTSSKSITAKWNTVKCTGYTIKYSANKNMSKAKTINVSSSKAKSKKISKLKKGKKYYVKVRAYYVTSFGNGKKYTYNSDWSKIKSITVK